MALPLFSLPPYAQKEWLEQQLSHPAPLTARGLSDGLRFPGREGKATPAAVLVPIINRPDGLALLLTLRSSELPDHAGQISFPGGRVEPEDASIEHAALREATEEIGLPAKRVAVLGKLAPYETVTGYRVTPVVGWVEPPFELKLDPIEVADVFEAPLAFLLSEQNHRRHFRMFGETRVEFWAIPYGEHYIWGATAAMIVILDRTLCRAGE
jgi:8-oxo-dGTP pyrophosphatase MutT (NUDIX family)